MKIGIYSPYLDTVGGGERYMLTIAEGLSSGNNVDVLLDTHLQTLNIEPISEKVSKLLNLDLSKVKFVNAPIGKGTNLFERSYFLKAYDLIFYLTDGSIFFFTARKNILHIQSPVKVSNNSLWKKIKSSSWDLIIYNSRFTKEHSEKNWGIKGEVVYPPVNIEVFKPLKKKKQILTVGRFFGYLKDKKHGQMIESFKKLYDSGKAKDWTFHLAGGAGEGDMDYVKELETVSKNYPIHIHPNLEFKKLVDLYGESSIYWHAAGFGETDPTKMEHFGITTVEAMASGCVPVVINAGGQKEIVSEGEDGFLWDTAEEMGTKTLKVIESENLRSKLEKDAIKKSQQFSKEKFNAKINNLIKQNAAA